MKDFLGQEYGPGDKVLYAAGSGRSITMVLAEVIEVYRTYRSQHEYKLVRLSMDDQPPFRQVWDHDKRDYVDTTERVDAETKVKVQPLNSSRWTQHHGHDYYLDTRTGETINPFYKTNFRDPEIWAIFPGYRDNQGNLIDTGYHYHQPDIRYVTGELQPWIEKRNTGIKPVTISVTDNIVLWRRKNREDRPEWKACKE